MSVTVVTATLPERETLLRRAVDSVREQILQPSAHLIGVDYARRGGAAMKNDLAFAAQTKWIALLDDDDYLYPNHLSSLVEAAERDGSDIAYSYDDGARMYRVGFEPSALRSGSIVSHNAIVRTALFKELGPTYARSNRPRHWCAKARRSAHCRLPCLNGSSTTFSTDGMCR